MQKNGQAIAGRGTGVDDKRLAQKIAVIDQALQRHPSKEPWQLMCNFAGFEIVALVGAMIAAAQQRVVVLVDGFICSVAALLAKALNPSVAAYFIFSHQSAEQGHQAVLTALGAKPLLDLQLRLGEASGAALAIPLLRSACLLHQQMATFADAGVSGAEESNA